MKSKYTGPAEKLALYEEIIAACGPRNGPRPSTIAIHSSLITAMLRDHTLIP